MTLPRGTRIDRYEILELLGTGGMGEVYRAHDPKLERKVALKVLRRDRDLGTEGNTRLLREARAVAALSHPNILAVYDVGEVEAPEPLAYVAMELVVGKSFRALIGDASVDITTRIAWLSDVARALAAAHAAGITHRDVKPENVMLRFDGVVKVLDFGVARRTSAVGDIWSSADGHSLPTQNGGVAMPDLTSRGALVGTPFYMAPEQLRGDAVDARTDQFAWGVLAYEFLTGTPPWTRGAETLAFASEILTKDPPRPVDIDARIPKRTAAAIMRALAKRPEDRFPSMDALLESLGVERSVRTGGAPKTSRERRAGRWSIRRLGGAGLAAIATALAALAAVAWSQGRRGGPRSSPLIQAGVAPDGPAECRSNGDCVRNHDGGAWHCHATRHTCAPIASEECSALAAPDALIQNDTVWLGGLFRLDPEGPEEYRAFDLAREDFTRALGSSASRTDALRARPIAIALCDERKDPIRAAHHLVEDVEVPAVVGFQGKEASLDTIPSILLPAKVLSFISISQLPSLIRIPEPPNEPRLVWRSTLNMADSAKPISAFVSKVIEPQRMAMHPSQPMRVAIAQDPNVDREFAGALFAALTFNGKSAMANAGDFREYKVTHDVDGSTSDVVTALLDFNPDVIIVAGAHIDEDVIIPLEGRFGSRPRPIYMTENGFWKPVRAFVGHDRSRRRRFYSVINSANTLTNAQLVNRYNFAFPEEKITREGAPQPSYDAFYLLAYATYAAGDGPITGPVLSRALTRLLPPGTPIDVGPASIFDAFTILRSGGNIDLNGALGSLDFDITKGEAPVDWAIDCLGVDDHGNAAPEVESGLIYDAKKGELVGSLNCP